MDPIGIVPPVIHSAPVLATPAPQNASNVALPVPGADASSGQADITPQQIDQKRAESIQLASRQIANIYVVSDQTFTMYKDATGQLITRYVSLRDGKVTYIPEPTLYKLAGGDAAPVIKIQA